MIWRNADQRYPQLLGGHFGVPKPYHRICMMKAENEGPIQEHINARNVFQAASRRCRVKRFEAIPDASAGIRQ